MAKKNTVTSSSETSKKQAPLYTVSTAQARRLQLALNDIGATFCTYPISEHPTYFAKMQSILDQLNGKTEYVYSNELTYNTIEPVVYNPEDVQMKFYFLSTIHHLRACKLCLQENLGMDSLPQMRWDDKDDRKGHIRSEKIRFSVLATINEAIRIAEANTHLFTGLEQEPVKTTTAVTAIPVAIKK